MNMDRTAVVTTVLSAKAKTVATTTSPELLSRHAPQHNDVNLSVAGEEDPGAALDMLGSSAN
jgi:hypothetical protein